MIEQQLVLVRGLPGSGKTTRAIEIAEALDAVHLEGDQYFQTAKAYLYEPRLLKEAHRRCFRLADVALARGYSVVVSNTFTRIWEMEGYRELAINAGVPFRVERCTGNFGSIHGVPEDTMEDMRNRWQELPEGWEKT